MDTISMFEELCRCINEEKLTRRDKFSMAALQGLLAFSGEMEDSSLRHHASLAIECADYLIEELAKPINSNPPNENI